MRWIGCAACQCHGLPHTLLAIHLVSHLLSHLVLQLLTGHGDFAVADDGSGGAMVATAAETDGVLAGVMRGYVLRACAALGIPVVQQAPHWSSHARWREAFLTNRWADKAVVTLLPMSPPASEGSKVLSLSGLLHVQSARPAAAQAHRVPKAVPVRRLPLGGVAAATAPGLRDGVAAAACERAAGSRGSAIAASCQIRNFGESA